MIPQEERRITIPEEVMEALDRYAADEKKNVKNPIIKEMITGKSTAQHILLNEVQKRGYYKPKPKEVSP